MDQTQEPFDFVTARNVHLARVQQATTPTGMYDSALLANDSHPTIPGLQAGQSQEFSNPRVLVTTYQLSAEAFFTFATFCFAIRPYDLLFIQQHAGEVKVLVFPALCPCELCSRIIDGGNVDPGGWLEAHIATQTGKEVARVLLKTGIGLPDYMLEQLGDALPEDITQQLSESEEARASIEQPDLSDHMVDEAPPQVPKKRKRPDRKPASEPQEPPEEEAVPRKISRTTKRSAKPTTPAPKPRPHRVRRRAIEREEPKVEEAPLRESPPAKRRYRERKGTPSPLPRPKMDNAPRREISRSAKRKSKAAPAPPPQPKVLPPQRLQPRVLIKATEPEIQELRLRNGSAVCIKLRAPPEEQALFSQFSIAYPNGTPSSIPVPRAPVEIHGVYKPIPGPLEKMGQTAEQRRKRSYRRVQSEEAQRNRELWPVEVGCDPGLRVTGLSP